MFNNWLERDKVDLNSLSSMQTILIYIAKQKLMFLGYLSSSKDYFVGGNMKWDIEDVSHIMLLQTPDSKFFIHNMCVGSDEYKKELKKNVMHYYIKHIRQNMKQNIFDNDNDNDIKDEIEYVKKIYWKF